ncbi:hypothetical protein [Endobacterium cereale]|uniref:hypothetical protein n=1 Tax=Endobacterium cereale TaxID=2663029 RepID=UPI002B479381|nr:hypothetical protein [Endobacterium cereale]MEB2848015.1 hypothetical protein [Endobacterium cereale]
MSNATQSGSVSPANSGTTATEFGSSVESRAQREDPARLESQGEASEVLNVYRLEPTAAPSDPRWDNSPPMGVVTVAARTTGDARIVATGLELDFQEIDAAPADDVTTINASAFRDEKLYTVVELENGRVDLTRGVLDGKTAADLIKPTQL